MDGPTTVKSNHENLNRKNNYGNCLCGCGFTTELATKIKNKNNSSGASGAVSVKICTLDNLLLCSFFSFSLLFFLTSLSPCGLNLGEWRQ